MQPLRVFTKITFILLSCHIRLIHDDDLLHTYLRFPTLSENLVLPLEPPVISTIKQNNTYKMLHFSMGRVYQQRDELGNTELLILIKCILNKQLSLNSVHLEAFLSRTVRPATNIAVGYPALSRSIKL